VRTSFEKTALLVAGTTAPGYRVSSVSMSVRFATQMIPTPFRAQIELDLPGLPSLEIKVLVLSHFLQDR
jgi:hypothetical protein